MTNKIIVDTNIVVGLYDEKDVWNKQAKCLMENFKKASLDLLLNGKNSVWIPAKTTISQKGKNI